LGALSPGVLGIALFLVHGVSAETRGDEKAAREGGSIPPLCDGWHRGGGETCPVDLERLERGYRAYKEGLTLSMNRSVEAKLASLPKAYDAGLPACRERQVRRLPAASAIPRELRERQLWFFDARGRGQLRMPPEVEADPGALLFVLAAEKLSDLGDLAKEFRREMTLAPRKFAESLGVRCAGSRVVVGKDGELEIYENH